MLQVTPEKKHADRRAAGRPPLAWRAWFDSHPIGLAVTLLGVVGGLIIGSCALGRSIGADQSTAERAQLRARTNDIMELCKIPPTERGDDLVGRLEIIRQRCLANATTATLPPPAAATSSAELEAQASAGSHAVSAAPLSSEPAPCAPPRFPVTHDGSTYTVRIAQAVSPEVKSPAVLEAASDAHSRLGIEWQGYPPREFAERVVIPGRGMQFVAAAGWGKLGFNDARRLCEFFRCENWANTDGPVVRECAVVTERRRRSSSLNGPMAAASARP